eukprot:scpid9702/ scgid17782/ Hemicentin-1; Fibulin-6
MEKRDGRLSVLLQAALLVLMTACCVDAGRTVCSTEHDFFHDSGSTHCIHHYGCQLATERRSWEEARAVCRALGTTYDLLSIHDEATNNGTREIVSKCGPVAAGQMFWIGLNYTNSNGSWADGSEFDYAMWDSSPPTGSNSCVAFDPVTAAWTGRNCNMTFGFICAEVLRFPTATIEPINNMTYDISQGTKSFRMACTVIGNPAPSLIWMLNGGPVMGGRQTFTAGTALGHTPMIHSTLEIAPVKYKDDGDYTCFGSSSYNATAVYNEILALNVLVKPTIERITPRNITEIKQDNVSLEFRIQSPVNPDVTPHGVTWTGPRGNVTNETVTFSKSHRTITLPSVERRDAGRYFVEAVNIEGNDSLDFFLDVHVLPVISYPNSSDDQFAVNEGDKLQITCHASAYPAVNATWARNVFQRDEALPSSVQVSAEEPIYSNQTLLFHQTATLMISAAEYNATGTYWCVAEAPVNSTADQANTSIILHVNMKPIFINLTPLNQSSVEFGNATFEFRFQLPVYPYPDFFWSFNGTMISVADSNSTSLTVYNLTRNHSGVYSVNATNDAGTQKVDFNLAVHAKPRIVSPSSGDRFIVNETSTLVIPCNSTSYPSANLTWVHGFGESASLPAGVSTNFTYVYDELDGLVHTVSLLNVSNAQYYHHGNYSCRSYINGTTGYHDDTVDVYLTVQVPPTIIGQSSTVEERLEFENVTFNFTFQDPVIPYPTYEWYFNGTSYPASDSGTSLTVTKLRREHAGTYTVVATNAAGTGQFNFSLSVYVLPIITVPDTNYNVTIIEGVDYNFSCEATAYPTPLISWMDPLNKTFTHDSPVLPARTSFQESSDNYSAPGGQIRQRSLLFIREDSEDTDDDGLYTCAAEIAVLGNTYSVQKHIQVYILVKPHPMVNQSNFTVMESSGVQFEFSVAQPLLAADITWLDTNGTTITNTTSDRHILHDDRRAMTISDLGREDAGEYNVSASNPAGTGYTSFLLDVHVEPTIVSPQSGAVIVVNESEPIDVVCQTTSYPAPTTIWLDNNGTRVLGASGNPHTTTNSSYVPAILLTEAEHTLHVTSATWDQHGNYTCYSEIATPGSANTSVSVFLYVQVKPTLQIPVTNFTVFEGENVTLQFTITDPVNPDIHPDNVTWYGPHGVINASISSKLQFTFSDDRQNMTLSGLSRNDTGNYTAVVVNAAGYGMASIYVDVPVLPVITSPYSGQLYRVNNTDSIELTCTSSSYPVALLSWVDSENATLQNGSTTTLLQSLPLGVGARTSAISLTLVIRNASLAHNGNYTCQADIHTPRGVYTSEVRAALLVLVKPTFSVTISNYTRLEAQTVEFSFLVDFPGNLPIVPNDIIWTAPRGVVGPVGTAHEFSVDRQSLTLNRLQRLDSGMYTAQASHENGMAVADFYLVVNVRPFITWPLKDQRYVIEEGSALSISCNATAFPKAEPTWEYVGNGLVGTTGDVYATEMSTYDLARQVFVMSNVLSIPRADYGIKGTYRCQITISDPTGAHINAVNVDIDVQVGPKFNHSQTNYTVLEGATFDIDCITFANPKPSYNWTVSPEFPATMTELIREAGSGPFHTSKYRVSSAPIQGYTHAYNLTCAANNSVSSNSTTISLIVHAAPQYTGSLTGIYVTSNEHEANVTLGCTYRALPEPNITWTHGMLVNTSGIVVQQPNATVPYTYTSTLQFPTVVKSDEGNYNCTGRNEYGTDGYRLYLRVQVPPRASAQSPHVDGVQNTATSLIVNMQYAGDPAVPSSNITWTRDINDSWVSLPGANQTPDRLNYTITSTNYSDAGLYRVKLHNTAGGVSIIFNVTYREPALILSQPSSVTLNEGETATFTCTATGVPRPTIIWQLDGVNISTSSDISIASTEYNGALLRPESFGLSSTLVISDITYNGHQGNYTCVASNILGKSNSQMASLIIHVPPHEENPQANVATAEGANV